jgi:hypothetical protein
MKCIRMWLYIRWVASFATHATCPIALMGVEMQWAANCHYNSKIELYAELQNTNFFHNVQKIKQKKD